MREIINELMDNYKTQNKIASVQSTTAKKIGEVVELQRLLKTYVYIY